MSTDTGKNPFEIRLEVLKMAQKMAREQHENAHNLAYNMLEQTAEYQQKSVEQLDAAYREILPEMYTPQDILDKATELYSFVLKKT